MVLMSSKYRPVLVFAVGITLSAAIVCAQDSPSLGDLARQQRQQKEKTASEKDAKAPKVITNEELPSHPAMAAAAGRGGSSPASSENYSDEPKLPAAQWKSQILAQKNQIDTLQRQVDEINESIRFAPANCVSGCVGWNERQREKQQRVERMQQQLEEQNRRLEDMQDSARKQGYGSSVYDP
jgi:hypothetical protein